MKVFAVLTAAHISPAARFQLAPGFVVLGLVLSLPRRCQCFREGTHDHLPNIGR
jgi:hypothetical protein